MDTLNYMLLFLVVIFLVVMLRITFSGSKEKNDTGGSNESDAGITRVISPQITVVFEKDIANDDELAKEIADMYISNRAYYYSGKSPPEGTSGKSEQEEDIFIRYEDIDFTALRKIDV